MSSDDLRGSPGNGAGLRASDAERDLVATELGEHFQAGRLDQAEFDERVGAALRARTRIDLSGLLSDLPRRGPVATGAVATGAVAARRPGWPAPWLPLIPLLFAGIMAAGFASGGGWHGAHHWGGGPWPLLWLWWLIPVALILTRRHWARGRGR